MPDSPNEPNQFAPPNALVRGSVTTEYALEVQQQDRGDVFADPAAFAHWHRVAFMFANSTLVPSHLRGENNVPNLLIALDVARRLRLNPLQVVQSLYEVSGTAGWKATFVAALAMHDGWDVDYEVAQLEPPIVQFKHKDGPRELPNLGVRAVMTKGGRRKQGPQVTSQQAIRAGWATKGENYTNNCEQMLCYRAITFAVRLHAPGLLFGLSTVDELAEVQDDMIRGLNATVEPASGKPARGMAAVRQAIAGESSGPSTPAGSGGDPSASSGSGQRTKYQQGLDQLDREEDGAKHSKKNPPPPCEEVHPTTGIRCTTVDQWNPNTGRWMDHAPSGHGYVPEGENFRVWWITGGAKGPVTREEMTASRTSGEVAERRENPPPDAEDDAPAGKSKVPTRNAVAEMEMIAAAMITKPRGTSVPFPELKAILKTKLGAKQLSDDRVFDALRFGVTKAQWDLIGEGPTARVVLLDPNKPRSSGPRESIPAENPQGTARVITNPDAQPASPEWVIEQLGSDAQQWNAAELVNLIADEELAIREDGSQPENVGDLILQRARDARLPVQRDMVSLDGAPPTMLRAFLAGLRVLRRST